MRFPTLTVFGLLSVAGMMGVALAVLLGFEEVPARLFLVSALAMVAGPVAILIHLALTRTLSPGRKRIWLRALASSRAPHALSAYLKLSR